MNSINSTREIAYLILLLKRFFFYCIQGGLKAVVWTDFIQTFIMFGSMLLIIIKGTVDVGGISLVIRRNLESGRLELPTCVHSMILQ